jgi:hypothetical protein
MSRRSFRSRFLRVVPGAGWAKPGLVLLVGAILSGCGAAGSPKTQAVSGPGFHFKALADWTITSQGATHGSVDLVEVRTFSLVKPYRRAILPRAIRELDRATTTLARKSRGRVTSRATVTVAGHDGRRYRIAFARRIEEITYVLEGRREYLLICRLPRGADGAPCELLLSSFALG